jgi:hypothetical protein
MKTLVETIKQIIESLERGLRELTRTDAVPEPVPVRVRVD